MVAAIQQGGLSPEQETQMVDYFTMAANHMINAH
jgi:truncated hemoglobin YjbI